VSNIESSLPVRAIQKDRSRFSKLYDVVAVCFMATGLAGCGPAPTLLSGTVTLNGRPVQAATLQFYPAAGDGKTSHALSNATGGFRAKVSPVPLVVTISKPLPSGEKMKPFPDSEPVDVMAESLAPRYSDRKKTELRVTPVEGKNTVADFALTSKAEK